MDNEKLDMITKFSALSLAIGIAGFIGLIAGLVPAKKAADTNPAIALRHE